MGAISTALLDALRAELAGAADPTKAEPMRAYMKSSMPCLGTLAPQVQAVCRRVFAAYPLATAEAWRATALALWREATYREERYAAIALVGARRYAAYQTLDALPIYEEMVVHGAWWDYVDAVSTLVGALFDAYPTPMRAEMLAWSRDADLWKRRVAIICQRKRGVATDEDLLFACILPNLDDREFFIRKAIGWALRSYALTHPDAVRAFVREHAAHLSPLSRREALKHLGDADL